jgi:hypothetical protein
MSEPAHANEAIWGKGKSLKAHDFAFAAMCRSCHAELDQGSTMSRESRQFIWLRGHVETMRLLWERGLVMVGAPQRPVPDPYASKCHDTAKQEFKRRGSKRGTHTATPDKCRIGWSKP